MNGSLNWEEEDWLNVKQGFILTEAWLAVWIVLSGVMLVLLGLNAAHQIDLQLIQWRKQWDDQTQLILSFREDCMPCEEETDELPDS